MIPGWRRQRQQSREDAARDALLYEVLSLHRKAQGKPYVATLMLNNIVHRYYQRMGLL